MSKNRSRHHRRYASHGYRHVTTQRAITLRCHDTYVLPLCIRYDIFTLYAIADYAAAAFIRRRAIAAFDIATIMLRR